MSLGNLFYLIGDPGSGKSTLIAELTSNAYALQFKKPFAHVLWREGGEAAALGPLRAGFPGTDGLSMSVQPKVLEWLEIMPYLNIFGEGDRLATDTFFQGVIDRGYELTVAHLNTPWEVSEERRKRRAGTLMVKAQNATWVQGRRTKVKRLAERWATLHLDGTRTPDILAGQLAEAPVFRTLLKGSA